MPVADALTDALPTEISNPVADVLAVLVTEALATDISKAVAVPVALAVIVPVALDISTAVTKPTVADPVTVPFGALLMSVATPLTVATPDAEPDARVTDPTVIAPKGCSE